MRYEGYRGQVRTGSDGNNDLNELNRVESNGGRGSPNKADSHDARNTAPDADEASAAHDQLGRKCGEYEVPSRRLRLLATQGTAGLALP